jgi:hypothetical protein
MPGGIPDKILFVRRAVLCAGSFSDFPTFHTGFFFTDERVTASDSHTYREVHLSIFIDHPYSGELDRLDLISFTYVPSLS